jgi:flagellar assembly protein FliH
MAKYVFRPTEVINLTKKVLIEPPKKEDMKVKETEVTDEPVELEEDVAGLGKPDLQELEREREEFLERWEREKAELLSKAQVEAEAIVKNAEQVAFEEIKNKTNEAKKIRQEAELEAENLIGQAKKEAELLMSGAGNNIEQLKQETAKQAHAEGCEQGFQKGQEEAARLIEQIHKVLSKAIEKRKEIIESSETQLINLVLLIAKKVVKVISENQRNVVINNVLQALGKLKARSEIIIRVNAADVQLTTEHAKNFVKQMENVAGATVVEDASVEKGGCIIETDFGLLDARITAQLQEIEEKILEMVPIKEVGLE